MKGPFIFPVLLILLFGIPAFADFQMGWEAYESGDYATAIKEWKPLAEQGDASAQYNMGLIYEEGHGVIQDYMAANRWYKLAAEQGVANAQSNLGLLYYEGQGVIQDYILAHMWLNISASQGIKNATDNRDIVEKTMTPSQIAEAQKLARECVAKNYKGC